MMNQNRTCPGCNRRLSPDTEGGLGFLTSALRGMTAILQPDVVLTRADVTDIANLFEVLADYGAAAIDQNDIGHQPEDCEA